MGRVVFGLACLTVVVASAGCDSTYDCEEACDLMRECDLAAGTSSETCDVRCIEHESSRQDAVDACGACLDNEECSTSCVAECVCALSLDPSEYAGAACAP